MGIDKGYDSESDIQPDGPTEKKNVAWILVFAILGGLIAYGVYQYKSAHYVPNQDLQNTANAETPDSLKQNPTYPAMSAPAANAQPAAGSETTGSTPQSSGTQSTTGTSSTGGSSPARGSLY